MINYLQLDSSAHNAVNAGKNFKKEYTLRRIHANVCLFNNNAKQKRLDVYNIN